MSDIYQDFLEQEKQKLSYKVRGAIFEVHKCLGVGLFEECYHEALLHELALRGLKAESKQRVPVIYKGVEIKEAYEYDILVEGKILIELKSVEELANRHFKQLNNYLHLMDLRLGFLVNFNSVYLNDGESICRVFNNEASNQEDI